MTKNLRNRLILLTILISGLATLSALSWLSLTTAAVIGAIFSGLILRTAINRLITIKKPEKPIADADLEGIKLHRTQDFKNLHKAVLEAKQPLNLAFEGGGARGGVYVGAVHVLEEHNLLLGVRNIAGSSAGGITAFLLSLGCSAATFKKLNDEFGTATLLDRKPDSKVYKRFKEWIANPLRKMLRFFDVEEIFDQLPGLGEIKKLLTKNGMHKGKSFMQESQKQMNELLGPNRDLIQKLCPELENLEDMTFEQFHKFVEYHRQENEGQSKYKDLFLTGTLLGGAGGSTEYFSWVHSPEVKLVDAVRITMSFPGAFVPHTIKRDGVPCTYVDGGVYKNLPAKIFDKDLPSCQFRPQGAPKVKVMTDKKLRRLCNPYTLNFKVDSQIEFDFYTKAKRKREGKSFFQIGLNLAQKDQISKIQHYYPYNTMVIHDVGIGTLQFELDALDKFAMFLSGEATANYYFAQKEKGNLKSVFPGKTKEHQLSHHAPFYARLVLDIKHALKRDEYKKAMQLFKQFKMISTPERSNSLAEIIKNELASISVPSKMVSGQRYNELKKLVETPSLAPSLCCDAESQTATRIPEFAKESDLKTKSSVPQKRLSAK